MRMFDKLVDITEKNNCPDLYLTRTSRTIVHDCKNNKTQVVDLTINNSIIYGEFDSYIKNNINTIYNIDLLGDKFFQFSKLDCEFAFYTILSESNVKPYFIISFILFIWDVQHYAFPSIWPYCILLVFKNKNISSIHLVKQINNNPYIENNNSITEEDIINSQTQLSIILEICTKYTLIPLEYNLN